MSANPRDADHLYARGEISRDEWLRSRDPYPNARSLTSGEGNVTSPRPGRGRRVPLGLIGIAGVVLAAILVIWAVAAGLGSSPFQASYGSVSELSPSDLGALNASSTSGTAYAANNTLWFSASTVRLVIYASPSTHDLSYMIQGLVDPSIHARAGSHIEVTLVNMDPDMYHNWAVAQQGPPYGEYPKMGGGGMKGGGSGSWGSGGMMSMAMIDTASGAGYCIQTASFTASSGTYWYLCDYPGHAADGMYGGMTFG